MAKDSIATPLTQFIGTGPYMFKERKPDQYVQLVRFDGYSARSEPASGYAGKREALLDELRFVPVPNANTRVEGSLSGQYHFADLLPVESYARLESAPNVKPVLTAPFGFPYLVLNTKQGPLANLALRQAVQAALNNADMLGAGFGDPKFYSADANHYAKNTPFYSTAGTENYGKGDAKKAAALVAAAKYDGTPIKILTSQQYDFHYRMALVMAENLKAAGFKVDMQVVDWSTLIQRRNDPALWDIYITHSAVLPEPTLTPPQLGDGAPGWWSSPAKDAALAAFNAEADPKKRGALWGNVQQVVFTEVPYIRVGNFNSVTARSAKLDGYVADAVAVLLEHRDCRSEASHARRELAPRRQRAIRLQTHGMTRYLASRFAGMVIVMLLVATLVFFITRLAPGDPAAVMLGEQATAADIAQLRASYGLDKPLPRAVRLLAGRAGARQSRPVDLPAAAGDAGAARARRADVLPHAVLDRHRDADRRSLRHRRGRVARQARSTRRSRASRCSARASRASGSA